ncbi:SNF2 family N-terminal domain-containing protein [Fusarium solani]|uniref:SNF2 family N-terminal domain-containing protein n=1 Tax=Fusarium solani TaxID=169388 RepID=A0A9P9G3T3_FUSSL|nr:SNF2 family N-terminal domain-containing protein [Fusarium solani]KAH7232564.1 SNF2 family N-terminal domain-containing protein [Fusarium solani]
MDASPGTNNALKRRRVDEETQPRAQEAVNLALATNYQAGYGFYTAPIATQQFHSAAVPQWGLTTPQPGFRPTEGVNSVMLSNSNSWNPCHSLPSQDATRSLIQGNSYQVVVADPKQPPAALASSSFNMRSSTTVGLPTPQAPVQNYTQRLPAPLCQPYPMALTQVPFGPQSWQGVVYVEAQFPHTNTTPVPNNVMPTTSTPAQETTKEECVETVCFGMIKSSTEFKSDCHPEISGHIFSEHGQMIQGLLDEETLNLYVSCTIQDSQGSSHQKTRSALLQCTLEITVYGPLELFGEIGTWHQKQALTFMLRREQGWAFYDQRPDVWQMVDTDQGRIFLNRISNAYQSEEPPQCYGGIVADPMGLGKTLTMIALAATDLERNDTEMDISEDDQLNVSATLIVVPPPLIGTWEEQLTEHVVDGGMAWHRHHREGRLGSTDHLDNLNIVLTTYHTVSAEWNSGNVVQNSTLFSVRWARIILDEAHLIRNGNSKMSQAVCALESKSRWAVTGTPIQNRLGDLATLFKFIRAHPYTDRRCFDVDISRLWKSGEYEEAIKRLKRLSACMLLRRPKATINLPARRDMQCPVNFSTEERALYDQLRQKAIMSIDEALKRDLDHSRTGMYANVLQQIESLRLVCNLGLHYHTRHDKAPQASLEGDSWANAAQRTFNFQREMGPLVCIQCRSTLEITETLFEDPTIPQQSAQFASCSRFVCADCTQKIFQARRVVECGHNPSCSMAAVSTNNSALESSLYEVQQQTRAKSISLSSKVKALMTDIKALPLNEKCIVFSTWRLTLDMVEAGLEKALISCVRFDGKVPQSERQEIVERFRTNPSVRVMLLTLSCGAAGLTLTVATRAYLMEPHWNPTLEEQALARIHRIGQKREVTTVRFYVRDSFEQHVIKVQDSKKDLAGLLLAPHDGEQADERQGRLQTLRSLI